MTDKDKDHESNELSIVKKTKQEQQLADMQANLKIMRAQVGPLKEYAQIMAKIKKDKYDAYIKAGFSPVEALSLVMAMGESLL